MANVTESPNWEAGIYQLETTDPVMGGANGVDNLQAKQLANRTAYLKQQVEQKKINTLLLRSSSAAVVNANIFNVFNWDTIDINDENMLAATAGGLITVPTGYAYARVSGSFVISDALSSPGLIGAGLLYNGAENSKFNAVGGMLRDSTTAAFPQGGFITSWIPIVAGDTLGMYIFHQGVNANLFANRTWLQLELEKA